MIPVHRRMEPAASCGPLRVAVAVGFCLAGLSGPAEAGLVINESTDFRITIDGKFTGGILPDFGEIQGEWSDVTPVGFASPNMPGAPLRYGTADRPEIDCLFGAVSRGPNFALVRPYLHTYFVFLRRTRLPTFDDPLLAEIRVPYTVGGRRYAGFTLQVFYNTGDLDVPPVYDLTGDGVPDGNAADVGIAAAAGFGPSPLSFQPHLMVEVRWPLLRSPGGIGPIGGGGAGENGENGLGDGELLESEYPDDDGLERGGPEVVVSNEDDGTVILDPEGEPLFPFPSSFRRGNANGDSAIDLSDAVRILEWLFLGGNEPPCLDAADCNRDSLVNVGDPSYVLNWLFIGGPPPPEPFSECDFVLGSALGCEARTADCP